MRDTLTYEALLEMVAKMPPPLPDPSTYEVRAVEYMEPGALIVMDPSMPAFRGWPAIKHRLLVIGHPDVIERADIAELAALAVAKFLDERQRAGAPPEAE
jgi:hypothetical protein